MMLGWCFGARMVMCLMNQGDVAEDGYDGLDFVKGNYYEDQEVGNSIILVKN